MKIDTVDIKGFKSLSNLRIDHLDPHLNLFIGVNGAGKSSILDSIAILLTAFTSRLTTTSSKGTPIPVNDISRGHSNCSMTLTLYDGVNWTKARSKKLQKDTESDYSKLNTYTQPFREQLDQNLPISVPIIIHYGVKRSVTDIPLRFPKEEHPAPTATYANWLDSKASYRDIFPWLRGEEDYENELIRDNPEKRLPGLEALRKAMKIILPEYSDMRVRRKPHLEVVLKKNGEDFPLSQLSDGEKCYIALVCDIVRRLSLANPKTDILEGKGIVLIDEVDLHLHPSWEQTIMERLHYAFPNIQFIVTAHSPLVASHFDGRVFGVSNGTVKPLPRLFGLDYSTILQDWMCTPPTNKEVTSLFELLNAYQEYGMETQADAIRKKLSYQYHISEKDEAYKRLYKAK